MKECLDQRPSNFGMHHSHLRGSTVSVSVGLGWDLRVGIFNKFPNAAVAANPGTTQIICVSVTLMGRRGY